jgi:hypothetical protein
MADYMSSVHTILQQVPVPDTSTGPKVSNAMYVGGAAAACFLALMVLSPSCVMSETDDGLTKFSFGKALLFSLIVAVFAYYIIK